MKQAYIVDALRTPTGRRKGGLAQVHAADLGGFVLKELVARNGIPADEYDDVVFGCVDTIGPLAGNIARTCWLAAGLPLTVPGVTVDRQCGSSQQAAHFAAQGVQAGVYDVVIACGVESMSRVPMFSTARGADTSGTLLRGRYPEGLVPQGISAELLAVRWKLEREELDAFSARSHHRAAATADAGGFANEIVPVGTHATDETVRPGTTAEGLAQLKPAFPGTPGAERFPEIDWRVTAGNSSPLTDGASAALIMDARTAERLGLRPRARFRSFGVTGSDPLLMLDGVVAATHKVLDRAGLSIGDLDAYEVNEAFAPVPLLWQYALDADPERLNARGGAIALGHPLGASGTRLLTTLVNQLEATAGRYGLQAMCEGGGMANATIVERF